MKKYSIYILLFLGLITSAQNRKIDSLSTLVKNASEDTNKVIVIDRLIRQYDALGMYDETERLAKEELKLSQRLNFPLGIYNAYHNLGVSLRGRGNYPLSLEYGLKSLHIAVRMKSKRKQVAAHANLGNTYYELLDYADALKHYQLALRIMTELDLRLGMADLHNSVSYALKMLGRADEAIEENKKALKLFEEKDEKSGEAESLCNIVIVYWETGQFEKGLESNKLAQKIYEELEDPEGIAFCLFNETNIRIGQKKFAAAKAPALEALKMMREQNNIEGISDALVNLGKIELALNNSKNAQNYFNEALNLSFETGMKDITIRCYTGLSQAFLLNNDPMKALYFYKLEITYKDSLLNEENTKKTVQLQFKYDYERKAAADSVVFAKSQEINNAELEKQRAELNSKRNLQYLMFAGIILVVVFAGFMYNRFRITEKQKKLIEEQKTVVEEQKHLVEEKQREILDSIHYAKRIQNALLPHEKYLDKNLSRLMK